MANPNISLLGATYSDVSGVSLPKQGGGTATFPWVEGSQTITQNNTYDVTNLSQVVVNVSGGGGASNVVTGTFKGTTTGAAMDITLNYSGSGYPIALQIFPSDGGRNASGTFGTLIQRYAIGIVDFVKLEITATPPTYSGGSGNTNKCYLKYNYKSSSSSATSYSSSESTTKNGYNSSDASSSMPCVFKSATKLSVFIASNSYGFAANIEYRYTVTYSS